MAAFTAGFLLFPSLTQLDLTGPVEVISRIPDTALRLIWKDLEPVESDSGLTITPTHTFETCGELDLLCVPGGPGVGPLMEDAETLAFLVARAARVRYLTSVCTGSLVLGAAGLLRGKRATSHWMSHELLASFGATPVAGRVVRDGNLFTGGGVTAGIDFGLAIAAEVAGRETAERIQLMIEYAPEPPFQAGSPSTAPPETVAALRARSAERQADRATRVARAAARLGL